MKPLAASLALCATLSTLAIDPVLAQPAAGNETPAQAMLNICGGLTWAELMDGTGPKIIACREGADVAFTTALSLPAADQEQVGVAFADLMRIPAEAGAAAPYPAASYLLASRFQGYLFEFCLPVGAQAQLATLETCTAAVRIVGVAAQAQTAEIIPVHVQDICSAIRQTPAWRDEILAVIDGLAIRAATGTDPVMKGPIDGVMAGVHIC